MLGALVSPDQAHLHLLIKNYLRSQPVSASPCRSWTALDIRGWSPQHPRSWASFSSICNVSNTENYYKWEMDHSDKSISHKFRVVKVLLSPISASPCIIVRVDELQDGSVLESSWQNTAVMCQIQYKWKDSLCGFLLTLDICLGSHLGRLILLSCSKLWTTISVFR